MTPLKNNMVLVTVSGPDTPGITSELTGILARGNATVLDIGQAVIHRLLSLSILFEMAPGQPDDKAVIKDLLFKATELGLKLEFQVIQKVEERDFVQRLSNAYRYAVTLIAPAVSAAALHEVTAVMAGYGMNIDEIQRLSEGGFSCVELQVSSAAEIDRSKLKKELLTIAGRLEVDIALQAEGLYRRAKRLVVLDMDSTLIQNEVIDEFARERGVHEQVAKVTEEAMRGKMDFDESLRQRVASLKGLTTDQVERAFQRVQLTSGAEELISVLRKLGYKTAIISGGFSLVADRLRDRLGIDFAYSNHLEMERGVATGRVLPPIVNAQRKADLLDVIAQQERIHLDQVVAIGDGANDLLMLEKAGLGIAFNAKPLVREQAATALNQPNLRSIFYLLGISGRDLAEVLQ
jgi:phosphoserine phosphatase